MGAGLAIGTVAKLLNPGSKVVVVTGDGGFVMNLGDLETSVRLGIDLVVLILNNNAYGMIQIKQREMRWENYGFERPNPDFIKLAESFGATGMKVEPPHAFRQTLDAALSIKGVVLVEIPFAYPEEVV